MRRALIAAMVVLAGCNSSPTHSLAPNDVPVATERDLSGSWCFTSGVSRQYGNRAKKQYTYDIAQADARWQDGKLIAHPGAAGNPFGWYHATSEAKIYRLADGRLVMTSSTTDTGLACALVPYREKNETVIMMRPATKGCPARG